MEVVVHVDGATLTVQLEDGTGVPAEMSRRLLCDSGVVPVLEDEAGKTLSIGRKSRTVPAAMRRALKRRDGRCQFPGCTNRRWLDAHHAHHWPDGGETSVENLIEGCWRHHRYVHEYGYAIRETEVGQFEFLDPMGKPIPPLGERAIAPAHPCDSLHSALADSGVRVSAETNVPGWDGSLVDYDVVISWLDDVDPVGRVSGAQCANLANISVQMENVVMARATGLARHVPAIRGNRARRRPAPAPAASGRRRASEQKHTRA